MTTFDPRHHVAIHSSISSSSIHSFEDSDEDELLNHHNHDHHSKFFNFDDPNSMPHDSANDLHKHVKSFSAFRWKLSKLVVLYVLFLSEAVRGTLVPSQAEYIRELEGSEFFLGVTVASFSTGRFITTLVLGLLTTKFKTKHLFLFAGVLECVGCFIYAIAGIPNWLLESKYTVLLGRFFIGLGAGSLSLVRAYFSDLSSEKDRTISLAIVGVVQYAGFALSPAIGSLISSQVTDAEGVWFDSESAPAWLLFCLNVISLIGVSILFLEVPPQPSKSTVLKTITNNNTTTKSILKTTVSTSDNETLSPTTTKALFAAFLGINFLFRAVLGTIETLASTLYDIVFAIDASTDQSQSTTTAGSMNSGYFYAILGLFGLFVMFFLIFLGKYIRDYPVLIISGIATVVGNGLLIAESHSISHSRFAIGVGLIWSLAFPLSQTVLVSMFSKLPLSAQAIRMSWIGSAGSLGRIIGPVLIGFVYSSGGMWPTFLVTTIFAAITMLLTIVMFPWLRKY